MILFAAQLETRTRQMFILRLYDNSFGVSLENLQESELSVLKIKSSTSRNETREACASKEAIY